ncbi:sucrose nonfermenting 4-like protein isoform X2 [Ananas comosus]|uniref:Sucrose nonfermenting 4-like protein isoform X2 n=1 Tax=Ananas comosus TaxID=4615 RepID=A0A6P5ESJ1_ANACO|nr:sucrose nonfermenting 4-like protein isoform X2 [Ananas comosus]
MDLSHDTSGMVLIPTRFVWPYGGRRVFLTGSFTRWSEHIPMSPVEGCPTVFQVICSLTPGIHQYKYFVDGDWRHDERQPHVTGSYGVVNTLLLTQSADHLPAISNPESPGNRMNMDVDSENFQRVVKILDGPLHETHLSIPEAEAAFFFQRISTFLSEHTAYELLPDSGKVIALDVNLPVKQAFHILYEQGIPVAPLWDSRMGQFVGVLSPLDFILILEELGNHGSNLTEEELETHTISAWKEAKQHLLRQMNPHTQASSRNLIHAGPYDTLKEVALKILQNEVATLPIIHSSSPDGSFPQLLHLATLSGILKRICRYFRHSYNSLPILQQPICNIRLGTWVPQIGESSRRPLAMLKPNASLRSALSLLVQARVSSIPIVDENDSLLDTYSRSDITALAKDRAYAHFHIDQMAIQQALQLGQDANSPYGFFNGQRCQMCLRTDPLRKVMERLATPGVRRVIVVEAGSKRVEGIISLSDVFRFLLGSAQASPTNA